MSTRSFLSLFAREIRGVHEAAYLLAFFTFGSQLVALLRDRLLAHTFGAGETLDMFYAAFRIPDTLYVFFASMLSLFVLIPFLEKHIASDEEVRAFLSSILSFFALAFGSTALIMFFFAPAITTFLYPLFSMSAHNELVSMTRILLLQPFILGVASLATAYVQVRGRFLLYAIAPLLYNAGIIIGVLFLYPSMGNVGLAWGVVLGALLHLGVQVPYLFVHNVFPRICMPVWRDVSAVVRVSVPRALTLSMQYITLLVLVAFASRSSSGSITSFMFAYNLESVPLAIVGASYSVASFPKLARFFAEGATARFRELLVLVARQVLLWSLLATVLFVVLRAHIVRVVFGSGAFSWSDTMLTSALLALFAISLAGQGLVILLVRACYAGGKTWVPFFANIVGAACAVGTAWFGIAMFSTTSLFVSFTHFMRVADIAGAETLLLAVAFSVGVLVTASILVLYIETTFSGFVRPLIRPFGEALLASFFAGTAVYLALQVVSVVLFPDTVLGMVLQGCVAGMCGVLVWALMLIALGNKDIESIWWALHRRITKKRMEDMRGVLEVK